MTDRVPEAPTPDEYFAAAQEANQEIEQLGVERYFGGFLRGIWTPAEERVIQALEPFANIVEPTDRSTGKFGDDRTVAGIALIQGGVGGYQVARRAHQGLITAGEISRKLWGHRKEIEAQANKNEDDRLQAKHNAAGLVIDRGERGLALLGQDTQDLLEDWEMKVVADATKQRMFRVGAGVVVAAAREIHLEKLLKQLEEDSRTNKQRALKELEEGIDWDKEFAEHFGAAPEEPQQP